LHTLAPSPPAATTRRTPSRNACSVAAGIGSRRRRWLTTTCTPLALSVGRVTLATAATYKARMKRWSLPASALVLVLIACGAGTKPAPRVTAAKARVPSVRVIAAGRERTARREAEKLLREFVAPREARRIREPRNYAGVLRQSGPQPIGELVDVHRFWSVRKPLKAVTRFLRAHPLRGFVQSVASRGAQKPPYYVVMSSRAVRSARRRTSG
jgi:hypothetical protein